MRSINGNTVALLLTVASWAAAGATLNGQVSGISAANTLLVLGWSEIIEVRLWGIEVPDLGAPYGKDAHRALTDLCGDHFVDVREEAGSSTRRTVGQVFLPDGRNLSHELVRAGLARWEPREAPDDGELKSLQKEAKAAGRGLWSNPNAVPTWKTHGAPHPTQSPASAAPRVVEERGTAGPRPSASAGEKRPWVRHRFVSGRASIAFPSRSTPEPSQEVPGVVSMNGAGWKGTNITLSAMETVYVGDASANIRQSTENTFNHQIASITQAGGRLTRRTVTPVLDLKYPAVLGSAEFDVGGSPWSIRFLTISDRAMSWTVYMAFEANGASLAIAERCLSSLKVESK